MLAAVAFILTNILRDEYYHDALFTNKSTAAQRRYVTFSQLHCVVVIEVDFKLNSHPGRDLS